ncbi:MAG TPA: peptidylprolyl isomerase [Chromatiales bacterium]|nr:peptidylprolyl isomerase [Chromatiales bacterium]
MTEETIKTGKFVSLTYTIADEEGNVLEQNDLPVSYIHGGEMELIGGMEKAVAGKKAGDVVEVIVPPERGFGDHDPTLTFTDDLENVPEQFRFVGAEVQMQNENGESKSFIVTRIENGKLTIDGNHPLAGKTLKVRVKILEVRDATKEDAMQVATPGAPHPTIN